MTVVQAFVGQVKPGKYEEALELASVAKKVLERNGAKQIRLLGAAFAAESYNNLLFTTEFEGMEALGEYYDKVIVDDEIVGIMSRIRGVDGPYVTQMITTAFEIPLGRKVSAKRGKVLDVYISRPVPGRFEAGIALGNRAFDFVEKHGAKNCRVWQQDAAGSQTETMVATMEYDTMKALGKAADAFAADPEGEALGALLRSSDAPFTPVSHEILTELPL